MIIMLNPNAHGGSAGQRWNAIFPRLRSILPSTLEVLESNPDSMDYLGARINQGERDIVAAGGDGTVNMVLQTIMQCPPETASELRLGAIGLGSSNDFHKPFHRGTTCSGIPVRLDFDRSLPRDVGIAEFRLQGESWRRWWLLNASIGVTADANRLFNCDSALRAVKRVSTPLAISWAALRTIAANRPRVVTISYEGDGDRTLSVSNIAVLKSQYVSGSLCFDLPCSLSDGQFAVHVCKDGGRGRLLRLLCALLTGTASRLGGTENRRTSAIRISLPDTGPVECDGEIDFASEVTFSINPFRLRVAS